MIWAVYVGCMRKLRNSYKVLVGTCEARRSLGPLGIEERVVLKLMLKNWYMFVWTGFIWFLTLSSGGSL
jgi:hypothetical protein